MSVYGNESAFVFHDGIFTTEPWQLAVSTILILVVSVLASSAGIGGGGLVVPIVAYVLGTGVKYAAPISSACIFGVSVGKNVISVLRRHPHLVRPLIHFDLSTFSNISLVLGTMFGVVLNGVLPEIILIIVLAVVLGWSGTEALLNGARQNAKETKEFSERKALAAQTAGSGAGDKAGGRSDEKGDTKQRDVEKEGGLRSAGPAGGSVEVELKAVNSRAALAVVVEAEHRAGAVNSADKLVAPTPSSGDFMAVSADTPEKQQQDLARFLLKFPNPPGGNKENVRNFPPACQGERTLTGSLALHDALWSNAPGLDDH
jgi:hypothetical protein